MLSRMPSFGTKLKLNSFSGLLKSNVVVKSKLNDTMMMMMMMMMMIMIIMMMMHDDDENEDNDDDSENGDVEVSNFNNLQRKKLSRVLFCSYQVTISTNTFRSSHYTCT